MRLFHYFLHLHPSGSHSIQEVPNKLTQCAFRGNRHRERYILLLGVNWFCFGTCHMYCPICVPACKQRASNGDTNVMYVMLSMWCERSSHHMLNITYSSIRR